MLKKSLTTIAAAAFVTTLAGCGGNSSDLSFPVSSTILTTDGQKLYSFDSQERLLSRQQSITGLTAGTSIVAMDFNPNGNALVAVGSNGQQYTIDGNTGVATVVGSPDNATSLANKAVDIDFNPRVQNVYRLITSTLDNVRRNATTGARATTGSTCSPAADCGFKYATGDVNAGKTIASVALAYTASQVNGGTIPAATTVFVIDAANDVLARLGSAPANGTVGNGGNPNEGILNTVGSLGRNIEGFTGFDIDSRGTAAVGDDVGYATSSEGGDQRLYIVNLSTGSLSDVGIIPPGVGAISGLAVIQR